MQINNFLKKKGVVKKMSSLENSSALKTVVITVVGTLAISYGVCRLYRCFCPNAPNDDESSQFEKKTD